MNRPTISWRHFAAVSAIALLGACAPQQPEHVAANPPHSVGPNAVWHTVAFDTDSFVLDAEGQRTVNVVTAALRRNPELVATVIGRTDTVGSKDYNMHLSHHRADAVRDAIVYGGNFSPDRVETRWTGERRQDVPTGDQVAASANRVVDIAVH